MFIKISVKFVYSTDGKGSFHGQFMVAFIAFITFNARGIGGPNKPWE